MSSLVKVINVGGKSVEIRLVKKENAQVQFLNNVSPDGCVNDETELSFKLGGFEDFEHIVLAHADTPNLKNASNYVTNGNEFSLKTNDQTNRLYVDGQFEISVRDPNYTTKQIGLFFRIDTQKASWMFSTVNGQILVTGLNGVQIYTIQELQNLRGVYFDDQYAYIPLFLATVQELVTSQTVYSLKPVYSGRPHEVYSDVTIVRLTPVDSIEITNATLVSKRNSQLQITTSITPLDASISEIRYQSDNAAIGEFTALTNPTLNYVGLGNFNVTVTARDRLGNEVSSTKAAKATIELEPFVFTVTTNSAQRSAGVILESEDAMSYVDWGDGTVTELSRGSQIYAHQYNADRTFTVKVYSSGTVTKVSFPTNAPYNTALREVIAWGQSDIRSVSFEGQVELVAVPTTCLATQTDFSRLFKGCAKFNGNLSGWNTANVTDITEIFSGCVKFNQSLPWNVGNVVYASGAFYKAEVFNQSLGTWNTSKMTDISSMFAYAYAFEGLGLELWNTSNVTTLEATFKSAYFFNAAIGAWNTSKVRSLANTFQDARIFNKPLIDWDVSNVTNMSGTFSGNDHDVIFNQDISLWNVGKVTDMTRMFYRNNAFLYDLHWWCVSLISARPADYVRNDFPTAYIPNWGMCPVRNTVLTINAPYTTDLVPGDTQELSFTLNPEQEIYSVEWTSSDNSVVSIEAESGFMVVMAQGTAVINLTVNGIYKASVTLKAIAVLDPMRVLVHPEGGRVAVEVAEGDSVVVNWGDGESATYTAGLYTKDYPNTGTMTELTIRASRNSAIERLGVYGRIREVTAWYAGITKAVRFNRPLAADRTWGVTTLENIPVTLPNGHQDFSYMFVGCPLFNQDITQWNVSAATSFEGMFFGAEAFNQNISGWNVGAATNMNYMFKGATAFNQDLALWCVAGVTSEPSEFRVGSAIANDSVPVWGTCPNRNLVASIVAEKTTLGIGLKTRLTYSTNPAITATTTAWSVDDTSILSVSTKGLITAKAVGTTYVRLILDRTYKTSLRIDVTAENIAPDIMVIEHVGAGSISLKTNVSTFVDWGDGTSEAVTGQVSHVFEADSGVSLIQIKPTAAVDLELLGSYRRILQWTSNGYSRLQLSKDGNLATKLIDVPQVSPPGLTNYDRLFYGCSAFVDDLSGWDTGAVTSMESMFEGATLFDSELAWDVSNVTNMRNMFKDARAFAHDISGWNVVKVTTMEGMFQNAVSFNQDIGNWVVTALVNADRMFSGATNFSRSLRTWCVSLITEEPVDFNLNGIMEAFLLPIWGSCPNPNYTLKINAIEPIMVGKTETLTYTLAPTDHIVEVAWDTDDDEIADFDEDTDALVAIAPGTVNVVVTLNGYYHSESLEITVVPEQIIEAPTHLSMEMGI